MKIVKILLGVMISVSVFLIGFYIVGSREVSNRLDVGYGASSSSDIAELEIGDKMFAIPKNYIWSREDWKGGKTTGVHMHALLPDFEPRTEQNKELFNDPRSRRKLSLLATEHGIVGSRTTKTIMTRKLIYERIIYDHGVGKPRRIKNYPADFGLTRQELSPSLVVGNELFIGKKKDGSLYWVECPVEGKYPTPSCKTKVEYSPHVTLSYSFPKRYLYQWHEIDDQVLAFIHRFEIKHLNKDH